jgi:hypothetical protein
MNSLPTVLTTNAIDQNEVIRVDVSRNDSAAVKEPSVGAVAAMARPFVASASSINEEHAVKIRAKNVDFL